MVNLTYGLLNSPSGTDTSASSLLTPNGTDLIATYDNGMSIATYNPGDISWILTCTALVWIMIPGLGYLYSGLVRRKNALSLLLLTIASLAVVSFQWFFWGYSLVFSQESGAFLGNLHNFGFMNVLERPVPAANNKIPELVYAVYECMFAALVPAIAIGAACERGRVWPSLVFVFCWTTLCYDPLACWIWNPTGWAYKWGVLDYAGGGPVEIASGTTGLMISYYLGPRKGYGTERLLFKPHNVSHVVLGTVFLWVGWLGFNGGSTFAANLKAAMAVMTTNVAGSVGGLVWMILDYRLERKWSVVGFCTGAIAGLVAITPAAGFVGVPAAVLIGAAAATASNFATNLKVVMRNDDAMDVFACHALSGVVGLLLTGIFAQKSVANNDGFLEIPGGWLDGHFVQLPIQLAWCAVSMAWCAGVTFAIMFVLDHTPFIGPFRTTEEAEIIGVDEEQCGEWAYDYAYMDRDLEGNYVVEDSNSTTSGQAQQMNEKVTPASSQTQPGGTQVVISPSSPKDGEKQVSHQDNGHTQRGDAQGHEATFPTNAREAAELHVEEHQ